MKKTTFFVLLTYSHSLVFLASSSIWYGIIGSAKHMWYHEVSNCTGGNVSVVIIHLHMEELGDQRKSRLCIICFEYHLHMRASVRGGGGGGGAPPNPHIFFVF